ncbi:hypothetical protein QBC43DRAFT_300866 [Cladorrhinum sp. PSN259]|nr:hypothetical protein QBC43DRAFT_300866 [Cladorrhinum sp. PSN259]
MEPRHPDVDTQPENQFQQSLLICDSDYESQDSLWYYDSDDPDCPTSEPEPLECFERTVKAITSAFTSSSVASSPSSSLSTASGGWEPFRKHWYDILSKILTQVEGDPDIPHFLTDPPVRKFQVKLYRSAHLGCPCCLPILEPNIVIKRSKGVTKGDLVRAVRDFLYGREEPAVSNGDANSAEEEVVRVERPVVWRDEWM